MDEKLNWKEKGSLSLKAAISALPYAGGPLATLIFDRNAEKRMKRLERFYFELADRVERTSFSIPDISIHDEESLVLLIENLNEQIEKEFKESKIKYFQNFFY